MATPGRSWATLTAMQPQPVPMSATCSGSADEAGSSRSAASTTSSVSGLGMSTAALTRKSSPQNSRTPTMYADGSRRSRRAIHSEKRGSRPSGTGDRLLVMMRARSQPRMVRA
jgi:hypothetical protein